MKDFERAKGAKVLCIASNWEKYVHMGCEMGYGHGLFKNIRVWARVFKEMPLYEHGTNENF
jgi:hypothetical protein